MRTQHIKMEWFPLGRRRAALLLDRIVPALMTELRGKQDPSVTRIARKTRSPFQVLVSTVISARTKDEVTGAASERLFARADTPEKLAALTERQIADLIFPAGFYRTKARAIRALSKKLIEDFGGKVPDIIDELLTLPGVGRKTANLVVTLGFAGYGICVDTHVHRIVNRLGIVKTKHPDETEAALRAVLPRRYWIDINDLLVTFGREICTPLSPRCSRCRVGRVCLRAGVERSR